MTPNSWEAPERILVVDGYPIIREGLLCRIGRQSGLIVCGQAGSLTGVPGLVVRLKPHLVLLGINLGDRNGLDLIKELHSTHPQVAVLALSTHDEDVYAEAVLRAGGRGYVSKRAGGPMIIDAIQRVLRGEIYLSVEVNTTILNSLRGGASRRHSSRVSRLTEREIEVLRLIGNGEESRKVATALEISLKTVETHRSNIKHKLKLETGAQLMRYAVLWVEMTPKPRRPTRADDGFLGATPTTYAGRNDKDSSVL